MAWPWPISGIRLVNALAVGRDVVVTPDVRFADGRRGLLDVYAPRAVHEGKAHDAPMVVFFYGGGWEDGAKADYRFAAVALANRGVVVAVADYRLYPEVCYPDFLADGARAVRWARRNAAEFGADPGLIFLMGHSAGAYIAVMLALAKGHLDPESLAALAGVVGLAGPYDFLPLREENLQRIFAPAGGNLSLSQPITYARGDAAPMLLIAGLADRRVRPENTRRLAARVAALGGAVETRLYRRATHALVIAAFSPAFRPFAPALRDTMAFIAARSDALRPRPGSPHSFQRSRSG